MSSFIELISGITLTIVVTNVWLSALHLGREMCKTGAGTEAFAVLLRLVGEIANFYA